MIGRALATATVVILMAVGLASASPGGQLDSSFSGDGYLYSRQFFPEGQEYRPRGAEDIALQADGKILAVGELEVTYGWAFGVYRFTADGDLDRSFGERGWVDTEVGEHFPEAHTVAVQRDGKIVVGGETVCPGLHTCGVLARYLPNGALDPRFGKGGVVYTVTRSRMLSANALDIQRDGKLVVLTWNLLGKFVVARYLPDGRLDKSFSREGFSITSPGRWVRGEAIALQADGKIVIAGSGAEYGYTKGNFVIARLRRNGRLDRSFATRGFQVVDFRRREEWAHGLAIQRNGKIVVVGGSSTSVKPATWRIAITRLRPTGALDRSFGRRLTKPGSGGTGSAVLVRPDGRIVVAGVAYRDPWGEQTTRWLLVGYRPDGRLDPSFGDRGFILSDFGTGNDSASAVLLQPDGKLVVGGQIYGDDGLARYLRG